MSMYCLQIVFSVSESQSSLIVASFATLHFSMVQFQSALRFGQKLVIIYSDRRTI